LTQCAFARLFEVEICTLFSEKSDQMRDAVQRRESREPKRRIVSLGTGYKRRRLSAMPSRIVVPPEPTAKERPAREVQQAARVEMLLLKGVTNKALIGRLLGIEDKRKVYRYVEMAHARWEAAAVVDSKTFFVRRGRLISMFETLAEEVWTRYEKTTDPRVAVALLRLMIKVNENLAGLYGLTPRAIARMSQGTKMPEFLKKRFERQDRLIRMTVELCETIKRIREKQSELSPLRPRRGQNRGTTTKFA
jgi:hypothetical protein